MKIKPKMHLIFGDLITVAFQGWRAARVEKLAQWASNPHLVLVQEQPHFFISSAKGRSV
jgi:hypothetical protein